MTVAYCSECGGSGVRMGHTREVVCHDCQGEGSWEVKPVCETCENPLLADGFCVSCDDWQDVVGDPFLRMAAE